MIIREIIDTHSTLEKGLNLQNLMTMVLSSQSWKCQSAVELVYIVIDYIFALAPTGTFKFGQFHVLFITEGDNLIVLFKGVLIIEFIVVPPSCSLLQALTAWLLISNHMQMILHWCYFHLVFTITSMHSQPLHTAILSECYGPSLKHILIYPEIGTTLMVRYSGSLVLQSCGKGLESDGLSFNLCVVLPPRPCP